MYIKLAIQNMKKSIRNYVIYFVTITLTAAMMYSFLAHGFSKEVLTMSENISMLTSGILGMSVLVALIASFVISYAIRFMLEERKKELMNQNRVKDGMMFKIENDPRIIGGKRGIGNFIRNYSIDEFPQFWNVLKGDMSLVGTRPPTVDEWEKYDLHHRVRLSVKPGITGMWQVSGRSEITDFEEVVKLDKKYITEWRMGLDVKILFQTVRVVLGRDGAM